MSAEKPVHNDMRRPLSESCGEEAKRLREELMKVLRESNDVSNSLMFMSAGSHEFDGVTFAQLEVRYSRLAEIARMDLFPAIRDLRDRMLDECPSMLPLLPRLGADSFSIQDSQATEQLLDELREVERLAFRPTGRLNGKAKDFRMDFWGKISGTNSVDSETNGEKGNNGIETPFTRKWLCINLGIKDFSTLRKRLIEFGAGPPSQKGRSEWGLSAAETIEFLKWMQKHGKTKSVAATRLLKGEFKIE